MYSLLHELLADKKGGEIFMLFGGWHFFCIVTTIAAVAALLIALKNKGADAKKKVTRTLISVAFGMYIADFFLMPLAYGEIDIEKLPFHVCTAMCVMCFLSYHNQFIEKYRASFAMLGFISNLVYLIYPAGVMWHEVHPLSYRVIQTMSFHGLMSVYGLLFLVYECDKIDIKKSYRDLTVTVCMTLWAMLGNYAYNGTSDGYSHFFNWFFVVRDPFYMLSEEVAPIVMPFLNVALFFAAEMILHLIISAVKRRKESHKGV